MRNVKSKQIYFSGKKKFCLAGKTISNRTHQAKKDAWDNVLKTGTPKAVDVKTTTTLFFWEDLLASRVKVAVMNS